MNGVTDASKYMAVIAAELAGEARMSKDKPSPATKNPCSSESLLGPFLPSLVVPAVTKRRSYSSPKGHQIFKWDNN